ncbi:MAG: LacI family DNA-binding transcriptional regulator [Anaerolineae bacterium]|jgi:DNA-binding LacI/PurR family transcriptional regulator
MPTEKLTIRQIAKLAGVSRSSVSRVLNDHPNVSPETREQVQKVIEEDGSATSHTRRRTHCTQRPCSGGL